MYIYVCVCACVCVCVCVCVWSYWFLILPHDSLIKLQVAGVIPPRVSSKDWPFSSSMFVVGGVALFVCTKNAG